MARYLDVNPHSVLIAGLDFEAEHNDPLLDLERLPMLTPDSPGMADLVESVERNGILQEPVAEARGETLVAGFGRRRIMAARFAGLPTISVRVCKAGEIDWHNVVAENLDRENDPVTVKARRAGRIVRAKTEEHLLSRGIDAEHARGLANAAVDAELPEEWETALDVAHGMAVDEVATIHHVEPVTVENWLVIDGLPASVQALIDEGLISASVALELRDARNPERAARRLASEGIRNRAAARAAVSADNAGDAGGESGEGGEGGEGGESGEPRPTTKYPPIAKRAMLDAIAMAATKEGKASLTDLERTLVAAFRLVVGDARDKACDALIERAKEWRAERRAAKQGKRGARKSTVETTEGTATVEGGDESDEGGEE